MFIVKLPICNIFAKLSPDHQDNILSFSPTPHVQLWSPIAFISSRAPRFHPHFVGWLDNCFFDLIFFYFDRVFLWIPGLKVLIFLHSFWKVLPGLRAVPPHCSIHAMPSWELLTGPGPYNAPATVATLHSLLCPLFISYKHIHVELPKEFVGQSNRGSFSAGGPYSLATLCLLHTLTSTLTAGRRRVLYEPPVQGRRALPRKCRTSPARWLYCIKTPAERHQKALKIIQVIAMNLGHLPEHGN